MKNRFYYKNRFYDNPKKRKSWGSPGHASTSTAKPNIQKNSCCVFDQLGIVYYELLKPNETITRAWGSLPNTIDEIEPSTQGKTRPLLLQA